MESTDDYVVNYESVNGVLFLLALVSLILNLLITVVTLTRKLKSWAIDTTLIFYISVFDSMSALFLIISQILKWSTYYTIVKSDSAWCYSSAIIFGANSMLSIVLTGLLSLIRYLAIVRRKSINNALFSWIAVGFIFGCWFCFGFSAAEHLFDSHLDSRLNISSSGIYCLPSPNSTVGRVLFSGYILLFTVPSLFVIPICYGLVINQYNKILLDHDVELDTNSTDRQDPLKFKRLKYNKKYRYKVTTLILVIFGYLITTLPEFLSYVVLGKARNKDPLVDAIVITLLFSVTIVNAIFVLLLHDETLKSLKVQWNSIFHR